MTSSLCEQHATEDKVVLAEGIPAGISQSSFDCLGLGLKMGCLKPSEKSFPDEIPSLPW